MLMHRLSALLIGTALLVALLGLAGCGGSGTPMASSSPSGSLSFNVYWPASTTREIPNATQGLHIEVVPEIVFTKTEQWVARPQGGTVSRVTFLGLPPGHAVVKVKAYDGTSITVPGTVIASGTASVTITSGQATAATLYLVPNGIDAYQVALTRNVNGISHIFLQNAAGGAAVDVTPVATEPCTQPALSHDGRTLAYVSTDKVWLMDLSTRVVTGLGVLPDTQQSSPTWSPVDARLAFIAKSLTTPALVYVTDTAQTATPTSISSYSGVPHAVAWGGADFLLVATTRTTGDALYRVPVSLVTPRATTSLIATAATGTITAPSRNPFTGAIVYLVNGQLAGDWITPALTNVSDLAWMPDGSRLVLCWGPAGESQYHLLRAGEVPVVVGTELAHEIAISLSPVAGSTAVSIVID